MAGKRSSISKKTRFEVFKRDGFKCVYCGACAPEAVLVVDHIDPVSKGGANDILNYATACEPCNAGKSNRTLSDNTVLDKQRRQLQELNERREQLEMMLQWRNSLKDGAEYELDSAAEEWTSLTGGWYWTETGRKAAKVLLKKHGLSALLDAMDVAVEKYLKVDPDGKGTAESVPTAWSKVGGILALRSMPESERRLYYVQGILRKRLNYVGFDVVKRMKDAMRAGVDVGQIEDEAKACRNWTAFSEWLYAAQEGDA